jgi:hypothetical protein
MAMVRRALRKKAAAELIDDRSKALFVIDR